MSKYIDELLGTARQFEYYKSLVEKSIEQINDNQLHEAPHDSLNSIAILMKHLAGNMMSRWTNFRTEDGEKPWRNRDSEFIDDFNSKEELIEYWEKGWQVLFDSLQSIKPGEMNSLIYIRNDGHLLREAIERNLAHVAYHAGQIVFLARMFTQDDWRSLTIPKGKSEEYNQKKFSQGQKPGSC